MVAKVIDITTVLPPIDLNPDTSLGRLFIARGQSLHLERHAVLGTRDMAREILALLPPGPIIFDCAAVSVMSPPFIHELLRTRDDLAFANMNEDVNASWLLVRERMNGGSSDLGSEVK